VGDLGARIVCLLFQPSDCARRSGARGWMLGTQKQVSMDLDKKAMLYGSEVGTHCVPFTHKVINGSNPVLALTSFVPLQNLYSLLLCREGAPKEDLIYGRGCYAPQSQRWFGRGRMPLAPMSPMERECLGDSGRFYETVCLTEHPSFSCDVNVRGREIIMIGLDTVLCAYCL
jgi:hypothetical protein